MKKNYFFYLALLILVKFQNILCYNFPSNLDSTNKIILEELKYVLQKDIEKWYPLVIDTTYGGYFSDINYKWELAGIQNKFIVTQARHIWTCAKLSEFYHNDYYTIIAKHGLEFLRNVMWDKKHSGFFDLVTREGKPIKENNEIIKKAYGHAFVIYGLSAYFEVSNDSSALLLAQKTFEWLENHSYDIVHGGYFQFISEKGEPFINGYNGIPPKDYNSMIHILEAYTELYKIWKDKKLRDRLTSLFYLIRDKVTTEKGYMKLYFQRDWSPIEFNYSSTDKNKNFLLDHVSFGHDIETAYLLIEAAKVLNLSDSIIILNSKKMVDHTLINGWDNSNGGIYDAGYYFKDKNLITIIKNTKEWWSQAEALNSFLLMSRLFPEDKNDYYHYFKSQWEYIKKYLIDSVNHGWFIGGIDIIPENKFSPKSTIWKCNYHTTRALINCINTLKRNNNYK